MEDFNTRKLRAISLYTILTAAAILTIYQALKNFPAVWEKFLQLHAILMIIVAPIMLGFVFAYLLNPLISWFEKHLLGVNQKFIIKKARGFAVVAAIITAMLMFTLIGSLLVSSVTKQLQLGGLDGTAIIITNFIQDLNRLYETVLEKLSSLHVDSPDLQSLAQELSDKVYNILNNAVSNISGFLSNASGNFTTFLFGVVISIYFMLDQKQINSIINRVSHVMFNEKTKAKMEDHLKDLNSAFSGYLRGQLLDVLFMMFAISAGLLITRCKFAIGIGVLAGLGNLIPYFGPFVGYGLTIIVCLLYGDYSTLGISLIVLLGIQLVDGNIIGPRLLGKSISVHPLLIILFLIAGGAVGGLLGMLLAVPLGGYITIRFRKWLARNEEK
ncbi:MAG: AI-2E family transporter [Clostridia bacterium]|nr:AI-2E family transporter [Clostridia bacterium]